MTGGGGNPPDRKVDIFVAGFQKCGTSALCDLLDRHPQIGLSRPKEPAWFSGGTLARSEEEYLRLFPREKELWVDGTTAYSFPERASDVARRIHEHNPAARFIFAVRNPVNRVTSALNHRMLENEAAGDLTAAFERAVNRSAYHSVISAYLKRFARESILLISMDDLFDSQGKKIFDFLNLAPTTRWQALRPVNHTPLRRKENRLTHFYRRHWHTFNRFPIHPNIRRWLSKGVTRALMRPPTSQEFHKLSEEHSRNVQSALAADAGEFEARFGFNYLALEK